MLNVYKVDESYRQSFLKLINNETLSDAESESYSRYNCENIEEKATQDAAIIKNMILEHEALSIALLDIEERRDSLFKKIEKAKLDLKVLLETNDIKTIKTPYFDIKVSRNPYSTNIYNEAEIPEEYIKETVVKTINKKLLLDDLKQGVIIPGAEIKQNTRIDIK